MPVSLSQDPVMPDTYTMEERKHFLQEGASHSLRVPGWETMVNARHSRIPNFSSVSFRSSCNSLASS